jgi:hypothetical protein
MGKKGKKRGKVEEKIEIVQTPISSEFVSLKLRHTKSSEPERDRRATSA